MNKDSSIFGQILEISKDEFYEPAKETGAGLKIRIYPSKILVLKG
ncbi:MAG: hypothetical protein ACP5OF_09520 [bacterium]